MSVYKELVEFLLPAGVLDYFEITEVKKDGEFLRIYLEEMDKIPSEYQSEQYRSNGFLPERQIKDFPLRELFVTLHIKRRRWLLVESGKKVTRDWSMVAPGTRITKDFASFLKELAR